MAEDKTGRRDFLKKSSAAIAALPLAQAANEATAAQADPASDKFQPEEFWCERMQAPDDGTKYGWFVDTRRCFGCHGCEVACKAENGNPNDPNSRGHLCARGQAGLNHLYHPERLLYPLKRVGQRGEGKWKRISWDEALDEIAAKLKAVRDSGKPEEFAFHQGRQRSKDALKRFLDAYGTKTQLSHRALCSGNRRAANLTYLWESDWDLNDVEHSKYILNFGSNAFEAHQGHIPFATRIQNGRYKNGAKLVTFDVRLSNTAGASDEWFAPFPGTDGAIALYPPMEA